jgi:hypothetical protein
MELQPPHLTPRGTSDDIPPSERSPDSSLLTRLTPDSDSDDSDLDMIEGGDSFKLRRRMSDVEKGSEDDEEYFEPTRRRASISTVQSYQLYTPDEERAIVKKFDKNLVLFVALLYMLSFLDRSSKATVSNLDS